MEKHAHAEKAKVQIRGKQAMRYNDMVENRKEALDIQFQVALKNKDAEAAAVALQEQLRLGLEGEIDKKKKKLITDFKLKEYTGRIHDNLFFAMPAFGEIVIRSEKHWIKRRELQYIGDVISPEKDYTYTVSLLANEQMTLGAYRGLQALYEKVKGRKKKKGIEREAVSAGLIRMYDISLANGQSFSIPKLGYIMVKVTGKSSAEAWCLLDETAMEEHHILIKSAYRRVESRLKEMFSSSGVTVKFNTYTNTGEANIKQKQAYESDVKSGMTMVQRINYENKQIREARDAEEELAAQS